MYVLLRLLPSVESVKQILVKLSVVTVVLLKTTTVPKASRSLHEQFKSAGAVSIYPAPSSLQFNVHSIPQRNSKTISLLPTSQISLKLPAFYARMILTHA
jgi:hypothetical protein